MSQQNAAGEKKSRRLQISSSDDQPSTGDKVSETELSTECPFMRESQTAETTETQGEIPSSPTEAPVESPEEELAKLQAMLEEVESRCAYAEDQHLRLAAELQNYKRRVQREKEDLTLYAIEGLVTELIPILDNFERAMEVNVDSPAAECLMAGVKMIHSQLLNALGNCGVKRINALGETFDPHLHEAVAREESTALPPNVVVAELAKGYLLHDRVLRPARVRVTVKPESESVPESAPEEEQ
ncbi:MAG: nucleotide exchange factor GrpE [Candidatus Zipacnadales bacterium]